MQGRLRRLSYNQLLILGVFLRSAKQNKIFNVKYLEKESGLKGKSLGGVLSALSRTRFRGIPIIEPLGRSRDGVGLRWQLQEKILDVTQAQKQVNQLLKTY